MSTIKNYIFRLATTIIFSAIAGAVNMLFNLSTKVACMLNDVFALVLDTTWIDWFIIGLFGLIGTVLVGRYGFFEWLENLGTKKTTSAIVQNNKFITFKEAVDYCIDFKEDTGVYIDIVNPTKKYSHDCYSLLYAHPEPITMVDADLYILLHLIKQNEIMLYGTRTETVKNIRPLDLGKIDKNVYLNVKNWSKDLNSLYDNDKLLYTNLCMKQKDIDSLIERGKLQKEHIIQGMLKNN